MADQKIKRIYRVLLAEDDAGTVEFVTAALERYNFHVREATDGRVALKYLGEESFDLILCDIMMPYVDGFKALEGAQSRGLPLPPVIMLTALHDQESVIRAKKLGAVGYLAKPCTAGQLLAKVKSTLALADADLVDKTGLPFDIAAAAAGKTVVLRIVGCPVKNPLADFMKAANKIALSSGQFKEAQLQVGAEFAYDKGAFNHLRAMANYLQKSWHMVRPNIIFTGDFFKQDELPGGAEFKADFTVEL